MQFLTRSVPHGMTAWVLAGLLASSVLAGRLEARDLHYGSIEAVLLEGDPAGPIPKAIINLANGSGGAFTDSLGTVQLPRVRIGRQRLIILVRDYPETSVVVKVRNKRTTRVVVHLTLPPGSWVEQMPHHQAALSGQVLREVEDRP